jgi:hypothetical protein
MTAAFAANTPRHIRGIGSVLEVDSPGSGKSGLQRCGPLPIGPGEPPHLVRGQTKITKRGLERLAAVDRIEELLAYGDRESLLRLAPEAGLGGGVLGLAALDAATSVIPTCHGAVGHLRATSAVPGIRLISDLM